jgi:hypothetical protein
MGAALPALAAEGKGNAILVAQPQVVAEPYVRFARSPNDWHAPPWIGAPSLVKTASGRLLASHTYFGKGSEMDTTYLSSSEDGGLSWTPLAVVRPMFWPSLFRCASGLYLLGVDRAYEKGENHLVISRSDDDGRTWSRPSPLTSGLWLHTGNTGVLISKGRVTRALETVPPDGARRFHSMVMDAPESADLRDAAVWRRSNLVTNPAYSHAQALKELFGFDFTTRGGTWLEGVLLRLEHPGGSGKIVNILRLHNEVTANLSARIEVDDSAEALTCRFERFASDPGLAIAHCFAKYDAPSRLYWMVSNVARDTTRDMSRSPLRMPATQERSNLALFYSRNAADWFMAGLVAYAPDWVHSFHYPYFILDGDDLLVVARAHVESPLTEATTKPGMANRHDSNAATFHRVRDFRGLVNKDFINYRVP